jgi:apolipoprotein N-acyltransferase
MGRFLPIMIFVVGGVVCLTATGIAQNCWIGNERNTFFPAAGGAFVLAVAGGLCFCGAAFATWSAVSSGPWVVSGSLWLLLCAFHFGRSAYHFETSADGFRQGNPSPSSPFVDGCACLGFGISAGLSYLAAGCVSRRRPGGGRQLRVGLMLVGTGALACTAISSASTHWGSMSGKVPGHSPFDELRPLLSVSGAGLAGGLCFLAAGVSRRSPATETLPARGPVDDRPAA